MRDFDWDQVVTPLVCIAIIIVYLVFRFPVEIKSLVAGTYKTDAEIELNACSEFLKDPEKNCLYSFSSPDFDRIETQLDFLSVNHRGAFWLGFTFNYLDCPAYTRSPDERNKGGYPEVFKSYFLNEIDIGDGSIARENDAPYTWAYLAGRQLYFKLYDTYGDAATCKTIYEAAGPNGKIAYWIRKIN